MKLPYANNELPQVSAALMRIQEAGMRITEPRKALLRVLVKNDRPSTIEELFHDLRTGTCDLVTVYRMLVAFEGVGIVRRTFLHSGTTLYMYETSGPRFYTVSRATGKAVQIESGDTAELEATLARAVAHLKASGFKDVVHAVQFYVD